MHKSTLVLTLILIRDSMFCFIRNHKILNRIMLIISHFPLVRYRCRFVASKWSTAKRQEAVEQDGLLTFTSSISLPKIHRYCYWLLVLFQCSCLALDTWMSASFGHY